VCKCVDGGNVELYVLWRLLARFTLSSESSARLSSIHALEPSLVHTSVFLHTCVRFPLPPLSLLLMQCSTTGIIIPSIWGIPALSTDSMFNNNIVKYLTPKTRL